MRETVYIRLEDAEQAVKAYAKACIDRGELVTDTVDMSAAMIRLLNTLPQERKPEKRELGLGELQAIRDGLKLEYGAWRHIPEKALRAEVEGQITERLEKIYKPTEGERLYVKVIDYDTESPVAGVRLKGKKKDFGFHILYCPDEEWFWSDLKKNYLLMVEKAGGAGNA